MARSRPNRKPTFLWQGLLIILPVTIMSAIGLITIRRDRVVVEAEVRRGAGQLADQLASALAKGLPAQLAVQDVFSEAWVKHQQEVATLGQRTVHGSQEFETQLKEWRSANPGLNPEDALPNRLSLASDGRQLWPVDYDEPPKTPSWFLGLTEQQRQAWDALEKARVADSSATDLQTKAREFVETHPPEEARLNAEFALVGAEVPRQTPLEAMSWLDSFAQECRGLHTESGLPLLNLVGAEALSALRQSNQARRIFQMDPNDRGGYFGDIVSWILDEPSLLTSDLLAQLENLLPATNSSSCDLGPSVGAAKGIWLARERLHQLNQAINRLGLAQLSTATNFWLDNSLGFWFCRTAPSRPPLARNAENGSFTNNQIVSIRLYPKKMIELSAAKIIREVGVFIPDYVGLELQLEGQRLAVSEVRMPTFEALPIGGLLPDLRRRGKRSGSYYLNGPLQEGDSTSGSGGILAESQAQFTSAPAHWVSDSTQATSTDTAASGDDPTRPAEFRLLVHLTNPELLFAQQRQRTWVFGGLILSSAIAACVGLAAAYRSFRRQLRLNELKSNFVSSVSHELRAPIASVRLLAEGLERGKIADPKKQQEYFSFIVQECRRLSSLIENVLDFSRIEQGRKQFEFEPTDILALTKQTVKLMEAYATERQVGLTLVMAGDEAVSPFQLTADGKALQQALINLIDNAVKHSPKGETVTVGLEARGPASGACESRRSGGPTKDLLLALWVEDHGEGIPAEEHEKIFERFYRLGSELRRETQGVGIGLSIVKHVVDAHRGRVLVRSVVGQGSRFTIELPVESEHLKVDQRDPKPE